jgi:hypothetical protein
MSMSAEKCDISEYSKILGRKLDSSENIFIRMNMGGKDRQQFLAVEMIIEKNNFKVPKTR